MWKKIAALVLAFALLCSLSACSSVAQHETQAAEMLSAIYYEDVDAAYALLHPESGVSRVVFEEGFMEYVALMAGVTWDHYSIRSVNTSSSLGTVKERRETCELTVVLRDERELILEYIYLTSPEGEGFLSFSLAGK